MDQGYAASKWERKTAGKGTKWKQDTEAAGAGSYCRGLAEAFGISEAACMSGAGAAWQQGVAAVSAAEFDSAIAGKGQKWLRNTVAGIQGAGSRY